MISLCTVMTCAVLLKWMNTYSSITNLLRATSRGPDQLPPERFDMRVMRGSTVPLTVHFTQVRRGIWSGLCQGMSLDPSMEPTTPMAGAERAPD